MSKPSRDERRSAREVKRDPFKAAADVIVEVPYEEPATERYEPSHAYVLRRVNKSAELLHVNAMSTENEGN